MCFYVDIHSELEEVKKALGIDNVSLSDYDQWVAGNYIVSGFSNPMLLTVKTDSKDTLTATKWGLIPFWVKDEEKAQEFLSRGFTLNARNDSLFTKPSFKSAKYRRCLIPISGFYEWRHHTKTIKVPHYITLKERSVFYLGGVWDEWLNKDTGELVQTCSIVTTEANETMEYIHNTKKRMPLILRKEDEAKWLDQNATQQELENMMVPLEDEALKAYPIKKINPRNLEVFNEASILEEVQWDL